MSEQSAYVGEPNAYLESRTAEARTLDLGYCSQLHIAGFELAAEALNVLHGEGAYLVSRHELDGDTSRMPHQRASVTRAESGQQDFSEFWTTVRGLGDKTLLLRSVMAIAATMEPDFGK